jgi:hypothetical protein
VTTKVFLTRHQLNHLIVLVESRIDALVQMQDARNANQMGKLLKTLKLAVEKLPKP